MSTGTLEAVFEHGSFRLMHPSSVPLREGQRVRLIIQVDESPDDILALAAQVYAGLSPEEVAEVEQIALQRRDYFSERT
jgi:predicted DNA-binding antitoxin AbrB/MazE fold protein